MSRCEAGNSDVIHFMQYSSKEMGLGYRKFVPYLLVILVVSILWSFNVNSFLIKMFVALQVPALCKEEKGITAIEYAIIGVAMASALFFIFDTGGFLKSLQNAWDSMARNISQASSILGN